MLVESLLARAADRPDDIAIIDDSGQYSYGKLAALASALGSYLPAQTAQPGIGLLLPSSAGFAAAFYGALLAGKIAVPINFLLGDREIAHCIGDSGIDTVMTIPQLIPRLAGTSLKILDLTKILPTLPPTLGSATPDARPPMPDPSSTAALIYTSGSSGLPKGVPLTFENLQSDVDASIVAVNFQQQHKFLGIIPLFHVFGLTATMLAPIQLGSTIVYIPRFNPTAVVTAIKQHQISLLLGIPSMFGAILHLKSPTADDFKSIYAIISGGEPLPAKLREAFLSRYRVPLLEAYGMTETSLAISLNTPQIHRPGSVGKPIPGIQIKIVDADEDDTRPAPQGQPGEICVAGKMVMRGYHNLPTESAAAFTPDHFFKTGDLGQFDADGFLFITGRKKDLIIVSGEKVAPREVEEVLMSHPSVGEAAVIGKSDPVRGQIVAAYIIAAEGQSPSPDELREYCRSRGLPAWKIPREIQIVPDLPRSPTGKILKRALSDKPPD